MKENYAGFAVSFTSDLLLPWQKVVNTWWRSSSLATHWKTMAWCAWQDSNLRPFAPELY